jgi:hypothetical protein
MMSNKIVIDPDKTYYVNFVIDARFCAEVKGSNLKNLLQNANDAFCDADFGKAKDIDAKAVSIEDEDGNFVLDDESVISAALREE